MTSAAALQGLLNARLELDGATNWLAIEQRPSPDPAAPHPLPTRTHHKDHWGPRLISTVAS